MSYNKEHQVALVGGGGLNNLLDTAKSDLAACRSLALRTLINVGDETSSNPFLISVIVGWPLAVVPSLVSETKCGGRSAR